MYVPLRMKQPWEKLPLTPLPCSQWSAGDLAFYFPEETETIRSELHKLLPPLLQGSLCPRVCSLPCDYGGGNHPTPVQGQPLLLRTGLYLLELAHGHGLAVVLCIIAFSHHYGSISIVKKPL